MIHNTGFVKYPINWKHQYIIFSKFILKAVLLFIFLLFSMKTYNSGFSKDNILEFVIISFVMSVGLISISFFITFIMKFTAVSLSDSEITGLNYWGVRKYIPFSDIKEIASYSYNKVDAIMVISHSHGYILIPKSTINLDELLKILYGYTNNSNK